MANKNQVTLTFAGETKDLESANKRVVDSGKKVQDGFDNIGKTSRNLGGDLDGIGKTSRGFGDNIGHSAEKFDYATTKASGFGSALKDVGKMAGGFIAADVIGKGADMVIDFLSESISLASDMTEALSKVEEVFGDAGDEVGVWAGTVADSMGLSKREALLAAGDFGNLFDQMGVGDQAAAMLSQSLIQAAVDLGSFNNADATDVINDMTSAFRGEYDSIQKYLPMMNAASVEQRALAMTGKKTTDELTAQDKMMAIIAMTTQDLGKAQGDFARTADGQANAQKRANAEMENAQAALGEQLMPLQMKWIELQSKLATVLTEEVIPRLIQFKDWIKANEETIKPLAIALGVGLVFALGLLALGIAAVSLPIAALGMAFMKLWPYISGTWQQLSAFWGSVSAMAADNLGRIQGWRDGVQNTLGAIPGFVSSLPGRISAAASGMWNSIGDGFKSMINNVIGWWNRLSFSTPSIHIQGPEIFGKKLPGVDIGSRTFSVPQISKLHTGGTFEPPAGQQEGLALLMRGEEVSRPGSEGGGGDTYYITVHVAGSVASERDLHRGIEDAISKGRIRVKPKGKAA